MLRLISSPFHKRSAVATFLLSILFGLLCVFAFQSLRSQAAHVQLTQQPLPIRPNSPAAPQIAARQMPIGRDGHTATLLPNGKVLVAGGRNPDAAGGDNSGALSSALLYDPATGNWTDTGALRTARFNHVAVLLQSGRALIAGGQNAGGFLTEAEIYDPVTGQWSNTGALKKARGRATITLLALPNSALPNAKALVAGGETDTSYLNSFELYDPAAGTWTEPAQKLNVARRDHTATRLSNGGVLVAGGGSGNTTHLDTAEVYDPNTGAWRLTAKKMNSARRLHTATLLTDGNVLVAGGSSNGANALDTCEIYDPAAQTWELLSNKMTAPRRSHSATLMPDGKVLAAFGQSSIAAGGGALNTLDVFDPDTKTWAADSTRSPGGGSPEARVNHTATMLAGGRVLLAGGSASPSAVLGSAELYENKGPATGKWTLTPNPLRIPRFSHTATLLANGRVLVAGGNTSSSGFSAAARSAEIYDPNTGSWAPTGDLNFARLGHTATLLANGRMLVAGGSGASGSLNTAEIYDPATGAWTPTANTMIAPRQAHTATLLRDGRVLVTGGRSTTTALRTTEIFNPATGLWSAARDMNDVRQRHTATLLPNGQVLVAGGAVSDGDSVNLRASETYDVTTGLWSRTVSNMFFPRKGHTATLLPNGRIFVASGLRGNGGVTTDYTGSGEIYDPASRSWSTTNSPQSRIGHTATLLLNGKVMITGGLTRSDACGEISRFDTDVFDVAAGSVGLVFSSDDLNQPREFHSATLLPNGQVLVIGGRSLTCNVLTGELTTVARGDAELFDVGLGDIDLPTRPIITDVTWLGPGNALTAAGIRFQGVSEAASGGSQSSATNFPIAQLRSLANEQTLLLTPDPAAGKGWTNNNFSSVVVPAVFPPGPAMLTVFTNGIPSIAQILAPGAAAPSQNTISISGRIFDVNGAGFQSTVTLRSSTGLLLTARTAANGEYIFPNLPASAPAQTASNITPSSINAGSAGFTLTVDGSGFIAGNSVVLWNGQPRPTTVVNSARVIAAIPNSDLTTPGAVSVVVVTNGVNTTPLIFTIAPQTAAPRPSLTSLAPASAIAGDPAFTLTVTGTGFIGSSRVRWNGSDRATTFASGTRLTAQITANDILNPGTANVTVFTPAPGGGLSNALSFAINSPPAVAGSVLLYPFYSSSASNPNSENTTVTISNAGSQIARVAMFFVEGASGTIGNAPFAFLLAPNQPVSLSMAQVDPGVIGYIIAVAVDANGCPIRFNFLRGSETINLVSGHNATLSAIQIAALSTPVCSPGSSSATLSFDGVVYEKVSVQVSADFIPSSNDGNQTRIALNSLAGDLRLAAAGLGQLSGLLTDDAENIASFTAAESTPQLYRTLSNTFPQTTPRFNAIIPAGRTGSMRLAPANRTTGPAVFGAVLLYRPGTSDAVETEPTTGGYLLRATELKQSQSLVIPKVPAGGSFANQFLDPGVSIAAPARPANEAADHAGDHKNETAPLLGAALAPGEVAQQGGGITYTITPSGTANNSQPVSYSPASRTVNTGSTGPSFSSSINQSGGSFNNQDFWAQFATLSISGAISGLSGAMPDVKLQLLGQAPYIPVPEEQKNRTAQPNSQGGYQFEQCFISGQYKISPMSSVFSFTPVDVPLLPLTMNQIGLNFAASGACQSPGVAAQPANQAVCAGAPVSFSVTPSGSGPFSYQWRKNGVAIGAATGAIYGIASAAAGDAGNYDVVIGNACGMVTSGAATLTVNAFSLSATNASFPASGGSGSVNVTATVGQCGWSAISNDGWIIINSGSSGAGNGVVNYSVAANSDPSSRSGTMTIAGQTFTVMQAGAVVQSYEADISPRPAGNGTLTVSDWVLVGRFVAGLDTPAIGSEFQRADCAPRLEPDGVTLRLGNGGLSIADWVQAGRYAAGLDPLTAAGGPTGPAMAVTFSPRDAQAEMIERLRAPNPRTLRLAPRVVAQEAMRSIVITFDALGGESALGFSVNFDATRWRVASIKKGTEGAGDTEARLIINTQQASSGRVGIALALPTDKSWGAGRHELAVINFISLSGADAELMGLGFADQPVTREVVDAQANLLPASYVLEGARPLAIVSAASFRSSALVSESIVAAFGSELAFITQAADTLPLPTQLGGAQVTVRDSQGVERPAPLFFISPGQINFQIPAETAAGAALVIVSGERGVTASGMVEIIAAAPGLFSIDASGQGLAAGVILRVKGDGSSGYEPVARFDVARRRFIAAPIDLELDPAEEVFLLLFGSGLGHLAAETSVFIGGERAEVTYAGPQGGFAGLDQVNVRLSRSLIGRGETEVRLMTQGHAANPLKVYIK